MFRIIGQAHHGHSTAANAQNTLQICFGGKPYARNPKLFSEAIQLHSLLTGGHRQKESTRPLVAQEQILGAHGRQRRTMQLRLGTGEHGGMLDALVDKSVRIQELKKFLFGCDHMIWVLRPVKLINLPRAETNGVQWDGSR